MRYPCLPVMAALLAGTSAGACWHVSPWFGGLIGGVGAACAIACSATGSWPRGRLVFLMLAIAGFGSVQGRLADDRATQTSLRAVLAADCNSADLPDETFGPFVLTGRLSEDASAGDDGGARLAVDASAITVRGVPHDVSGGVSLTVVAGVDAAGLASWRRGRLVSVLAQLRRPARYLNPGTPDLELASARRGTTLVGTVKHAALVDVIAPGGWLDEWTGAMRQVGRSAIQRAVGRWNARSAAVAQAVILGDRTGLDVDTEDRLQRAGTYHVIAISGGNIAILAGVLYFALRGVFVRAGVVEVLVSLLLTAYAALVGGGASVTRATTMAVVMLLARAIDAKGPPLNALAVAATAGLACDPLIIFDAGAWLTYGATAAIICGAPGAQRLLARWPAWMRPAGQLFAASCCTELALFPIAALVFSRVTVAGLLLNFIAIPAMTVVQLSAMAIVVLTGGAEGAASALGAVAHGSAWVLVESARAVDVLPFLTTRLPPPPWWLVAVYAALWLVGIACRRARLAAVLLLAALAGVMLVAPPFGLAAGDELTVTWIDVGQGDAELITFPGGESWLVDAGGSLSRRFDIGRRVVEPAVWARGVRRLSRVVMTHGDNDHAGGAPTLVRDLLPREIWEGVPVPQDENVAALHRAAAESGAVWRHVERGQRTSVSGVGVEVWNPGPADFERWKVRNDDSVVVALRYRDVLIVLAGDIEASTEADLAAWVTRAPITIVQAPHHGSRSSSSAPWIDVLHPRAVMISAGRNNRFGHPAQATLNRYEAGGAARFRTDQDGAITLATDGRSVRVSTFTGRKMTVPPV